ncbi:hypothetical protein BH11MYX1_BH11MYX1_01890 [soil metagenome]
MPKAPNRGTATAPGHGGEGTNTCGGPACMPLTCAAENAECGIIGDGCDTTVDCGHVRTARPAAPAASRITAAAFSKRGDQSRVDCIATLRCVNAINP